MLLRQSCGVDDGVDFDEAVAPPELLAALVERIRHQVGSRRAFLAQKVLAGGGESGADAFALAFGPHTNHVNPAEVAIETCHGEAFDVFLGFDHENRRARRRQRPVEVVRGVVPRRCDAGGVPNVDGRLLVLGGCFAHSEHGRQE